MRIGYEGSSWEEITILNKDHPLVRKSVAQEGGKREIHAWEERMGDTGDDFELEQRRQNRTKIQLRDSAKGPKDVGMNYTRS